LIEGRIDVTVRPPLLRFVRLGVAQRLDQKDGPIRGGRSVFTIFGGTEDGQVFVAGAGGHFDAAVGLLPAGENDGGQAELLLYPSDDGRQILAGEAFNPHS
jgi:hypothetical protein